MPLATQLINTKFTDYVTELQGWIRQPSIAAEGTGMTEMAGLVSQRLKGAGGTARVFEITEGYPVVYAEFKGKSQYTLLFYNHYDVQPPGDRSEWRCDPFAAEIAEGRLYGRGVADNKGCLLSRIQAVEAILNTTNELPINVKFLVEGEEEIGSSHLEPFVLEHQALLEADACIWEYAAKDARGRPSATLGNKGMCYVELTAKGAKVDFHSMYAGLIPNAAWRLTWALATLKDEEENISPEEIELLERTPLDEEGFAREAGISELLGGVTAIEAQRRLYGSPTCTICGLVSGYTGKGTRTVLPAVARAKVDFRLVVDQDPQDIMRKLRAHLDCHGFADIDVNLLTASLPIKTPVTHPFVQVVVDAASRVYDQPLVVQPTSPGTGPRSAFAGWTDMPIVGLGVAHLGSQVHGPNENIVLEDYRQGIKHIVAIIELLGV
jgi:acetylornithine deacetylase/succinyl-diaminopimelate desuccinylase-like protein